MQSRLAAVLHSRDKAAGGLSNPDRVGLSETRRPGRTHERAASNSRFPTTSTLPEANQCHLGNARAARLRPTAGSANDLDAKSRSKVLVVRLSSCCWSNTALGRSPNEFVHLELKTNIEFVRQNPFHDLARVD